MTYNIIYKIVKKSETIYYRGIGKNKGGILKHKSCLLQSDFFYIQHAVLHYLSKCFSVLY